MMGVASGVGTPAAGEIAMMAVLLRTTDARYSFPQNIGSLETAEDGIH